MDNVVDFIAAKNKTAKDGEKEQRYTNADILSRLAERLEEHGERLNAHDSPELWWMGEDLLLLSDYLKKYFT